MSVAYDLWSNKFYTLIKLSIDFLLNGHSHLLLGILMSNIFVIKSFFILFDINTIKNLSCLYRRVFHNNLI